MCRLIIDPTVPAEVREQVEELVNRRLYLVPSWVHKLTVKWSHEGAEHLRIAWSAWNRSYRWAEIGLRPLWLESDAVERESYIVHELLHLTTAPMADLIQKVQEKLAEVDSGLGEWIEADAVSAVEETVCDLTHALAYAQDSRDDFVGPV